MVETDLQGAVGGLSEEGGSNASVCVCVREGGGGGGGVRKSPDIHTTNLPTNLRDNTQTESGYVSFKLSVSQTFEPPDNADAT